LGDRLRQETAKKNAKGVKEMQLRTRGKARRRGRQRVERAPTMTPTLRLGRSWAIAIL
jgi:hypothetical protein